jgi:hypothetical protein
MPLFDLSQVQRIRPTEEAQTAVHKKLQNPNLRVCKTAFNQSCKLQYQLKDDLIELLLPEEFSTLRLRTRTI